MPREREPRIEPRLSGHAYIPDQDADADAADAADAAADLAPRRRSTNSTLPPRPWRRLWLRDAKGQLTGWNVIDAWTDPVFNREQQLRRNRERRGSRTRSRSPTDLRERLRRGRRSDEAAASLQVTVENRGDSDSQSEAGDRRVVTDAKEDFDLREVLASKAADDAGRKSTPPSTGNDDAQSGSGDANGVKCEPEPPGTGNDEATTTEQPGSFRKA